MWRTTGIAQGTTTTISIVPAWAAGVSRGAPAASLFSCCGCAQPVHSLEETHHDQIVNHASHRRSCSRLAARHTPPAGGCAEPSQAAALISPTGRAQPWQQCGCAAIARMQQGRTIGSWGAASHQHRSANCGPPGSPARRCAARHMAAFDRLRWSKNRQRSFLTDEFQTGCGTIPSRFYHRGCHLGRTRAAAARAASRS
jgi:hypothetical protein